MPPKKLAPLRGKKGKNAPAAPSMSFSMLDELQEQLMDYEQDLKTSSANGSAVSLAHLPAEACT
jgi:hypothetical protein